MPAEVGTAHQLPFFAGIGGLSILDVAVFVFSVDGQAVSTNVSNSLQITEVISGYYLASYVPDTQGFHNLCFAINGFNICEGVDISEVDQVVNLIQDTGGVNALKVTQVLNPDEFMLFVFASSDWAVGRTGTSYSQASTELDTNGNWLATPLVVQPGTYHIVIMDNFGTIKVIKPNLVLST